MVHFLFKNLGVKIICILAAIGLWFFVSLTQNSISKFPGTIPIKTINTPSGLVATYDQSSVEIKVSADSVVWRKLSADSFTAYVDLSTYKEGTYEALVSVNSVISGVTIAQVTPNHVLVTLEPSTTKQVPVAQKIGGNAKDGFTTGNITFTPDTVELRGAKSKIDAISEVSALINLDGTEEESFEKNYSMAVLDPSGEKYKDIDINPSEVKAKVPIIRASNNKTVGIRVSTSGQPKTGYFISSIAVTPSVINIIASAGNTGDIKYIETEPIDLTNLSSDIEKEVALKVPSAVSLIIGESPKVKVKISFSPIDTTKEISVSKVQALNLTDNFRIKDILPSPIKVICSGSASVLNSLSAGDISVTVDFQNIAPAGAGTKNFDLYSQNFRTPDGVSVIGIIPSTINVEIVSN